MPGAHGDVSKVIVLRIESNGDVFAFCEGGCDAFVAIDAISFRVGLGGAWAVTGCPSAAANQTTDSRPETFSRD